MNRRRFLAGSLATAPWWAGCLSRSTGGTPSGPTVSIVDQDDLPDIPVRPAVEVIESRATDRAPAMLRAIIENTADYTVQVGEERAVVFAYVHSEAQPGLVLLPMASDHEPVETGCWRLGEPVVTADYYGAYLPEPGESIERELGVWATHDAGACLPSGEFRFGSEFAGAPDRGDDLEEPEWRTEWGFTLAVDE